MDIRDETIKQLRNKRYSYQKIGDLFGLSRQRIHQIINEVPLPIRIKKEKYYPPITKIPSDWEPRDCSNINLYNKREGRDYLKEKVRIRDDYTCQICNKVWQKGQRRLDVHHLDEHLEGEEGLKYKNCKNLDRMITLCHKCHLRLDIIRLKFNNCHKKRLTPLLEGETI